MFHNCIKRIKNNIRTNDEDSKKKPKDIGKPCVKTDYKDRMDQLRPPKLTINKRRMRIYWYHREV